MKTLLSLLCSSLVCWISCASAGSVGGQYGASSYGGGLMNGDYNGGGGGGDSGSYPGASSSYAQPDYGGYSVPRPTKYPPAMTHERNRQQTGYQAPASVKMFSEHFEGLFDDFPGPKTKQKVYYPGRGYIYMQVPVQQHDQYSKPGQYNSGQYTPDTPSSYGSSSSYGGNDDDSYSAPPAPQYRPSRPAYSAPAPAPASYGNSGGEDDDSPFAYMANKGAGSSYVGQNYSPTYSAPKPPTPYIPPSNGYQPPKPSYSPPPPPPPPPSSGGDNTYSPSQSYQGSSHGSYSTFNPSGYKPSGAYPSSYPDDKSASTNTFAEVEPIRNSDAAVPSGGEYFDHAGRSSDARSDDSAAVRGFYDLAEQVEQPQAPSLDGAGVGN